MYFIKFLAFCINSTVSFLPDIYFFTWFPCSWYLSSYWQHGWHATETTDKSNIAVETSTKYGYVTSLIFAVAIQKL